LQNLLGFSLVTSFLNLIPYSLLILPISLLLQNDLRIFTLSKKEDCLKLQEKIGKVCTHSTENGGYGFSFGYWYILNLDVKSSNDGTTYSAWIVCTKRRFDLLMEESPQKKKTIKNLENTQKSMKEEFYVLEKSTGNYSNTYYRMRTLERYCIVPSEAQQKIVDSELEIFRGKGSAVFFVSGPCGRGKSMTAVFLAKALNAMYCEDCTPWEPGDSVQSMYMDFQHDTLGKKPGPIIVCFDEIDVVLEKMHAKQIPNNETVQTSVRDKMGWNKLFSKIERGLYPNLIIVMTSNKSPEEITVALGNDRSFLRKGRIDRFYTL
jgi:hypothetical protein